MGKRKKTIKKRKAKALSAFGLKSVADYYETAPHDQYSRRGRGIYVFRHNYGLLEDREKKA